MCVFCSRHYVNYSSAQLTFSSSFIIITNHQPPSPTPQQQTSSSAGGVDIAGRVFGPQAVIGYGSSTINVSSIALAENPVFVAGLQGAVGRGLLSLLSGTLISTTLSDLQSAGTASAKEIAVFTLLTSYYVKPLSALNTATALMAACTGNCTGNVTQALLSLTLARLPGATRSGITSAAVAISNDCAGATGCDSIRDALQQVEVANSGYASITTALPVSLMTSWLPFAQTSNPHRRLFWLDRTNAVAFKRAMFSQQDARASRVLLPAGLVVTDVAVSVNCVLVFLVFGFWFLVFGFWFLVFVFVF